MMWKTLIFLAVTSVVLAGKLNHERHASYSFKIKHDYNYLKHQGKLENESETEEQVQDDKKEEVRDETEAANEGEAEGEGEGDSSDSNAESEESGNDKGDEPSGYEFLYKVKDPHTHDNKGQHEKKDGYEVKGVYWLLQPDGYKRTVDYHVDKHNGFHAKVDYSKLEENANEEDHTEPKSEYYVKTYRGSKKYIPVQEEQEEEEEQDRQEESAQHIPIYVI